MIDDIGIELVTVREVGAHRRVEAASSPRDLADIQGNGHADAGAKAGVSLHPSDPPLLLEIKRKKKEVMNVCKFITQVMKVNFSKGPLPPPLKDSLIGPPVCMPLEPITGKEGVQYALGPAVKWESRAANTMS